MSGVSNDRVRLPREIKGRAATSRAETDEIERLLPQGGRMLEIGTESGGTVSLLAVRRRDCKFLSVDIFLYDGGLHAGNWLANKQPNMSLFVGTVNDLVDRCRGLQFDLVLVDGDHGRAGVLNDLLTSASLVSEGGYLTVHDFGDPGWPGVAQAVREFCSVNPEWVLDHTVDSLGVLTKMNYARIRAVTVCVEYDDLLRITLPRTVQEVDHLVVVTNLTDKATYDYCSELPNVSVFRTDAFYRGGARFNKGLALEEAFDYMGRDGWILVLDADIYLPGKLKAVLPELRVGKLYSPLRRILTDPKKLPKTDDWSSLPRRMDLGLYGYFQLFHASDPVLVRRPWYGTDWTHAGGCDKEFQEHWARWDKIRPPFDVLHLGLPDENWFGRSSARLDGTPIPEATARKALQEKLKRKHGWSRRRTNEVLDEKVGGTSDERPDSLGGIHGHTVVNPTLQQESLQQGGSSSRSRRPRGTAPPDGSQQR